MSVSRNLQLAHMLATNEARHFGIAAHIDQVSRYAEIIAKGLGIKSLDSPTDAEAKPSSTTSARSRHPTGSC